MVCECQHCGGRIEFDASTLPMEGQVIDCPHCQAKTRLRVPRPAIAQRINPHTTRAALESRLDNAAGGVFFVGAIAAVVAGGFSVQYFANDATGSGIVVLLCAAVVLFLAYAAQLIFLAFAEMVRVSKRRAGLLFAGKVTGQKIFVCSACGADVREGEEKCPVCGASF